LRDKKIPEYKTGIVMIILNI
jgi:hypothetical protein